MRHPRAPGDPAPPHPGLDAVSRSHIQRGGGGVQRGRLGNEVIPVGPDFGFGPRGRINACGFKLGMNISRARNQRRLGSGGSGGIKSDIARGHAAQGFGRSAKGFHQTLLGNHQGIGGLGFGKGNAREKGKRGG